MGYINQKITEFTVNAYQQKKIKQVSLQDTLGHWSVFFYYAGDFSAVSERELSDLQSLYADFQKEDAEIYAVSDNSVSDHKKWVASSERIDQVNYPLLADNNHILAKMFASFDEESNETCPGTFIICPGRKFKVFELNTTGIARDAQPILKMLRSVKDLRKNKNSTCSISCQR